MALWYNLLCTFARVHWRREHAPPIEVNALEVAAVAWRTATHFLGLRTLPSSVRCDSTSALRRPTASGVGGSIPPSLPTIKHGSGVLSSVPLILVSADLESGAEAASLRTRRRLLRTRAASRRCSFPV